MARDYSPSLYAYAYGDEHIGRGGMLAAVGIATPEQAAEFAPAHLAAVLTEIVRTDTVLSDGARNALFKALLNPESVQVLRQGLRNDLDGVFDRLTTLGSLKAGPFERSAVERASLSVQRPLTGNAVNKAFSETGLFQFVRIEKVEDEARWVGAAWLGRTETDPAFRVAARGEGHPAFEAVSGPDARSVFDALQPVLGRQLDGINVKAKVIAAELDQTDPVPALDWAVQGDAKTGITARAVLPQGAQLEAQLTPMGEQTRLAYAAKDAKGTLLFEAQKTLPEPMLDALKSLASGPAAKTLAGAALNAGRMSSKAQSQKRKPSLER